MNISYVQALHKWEQERPIRRAKEALFRKIDGLVHVVELHCPMTILKYFQGAIDVAIKYKGKRTLVLAGDNVNFDMVSHFWDSATTTSRPLYEVVQLCHLISEAYEVYDSIVMISANHENRIAKLLSRKMDKEQAKAIGEIMPTLEAMIRREGIGDKLVYHNGNFIKLGDVLVCHMENNSRILGRTALQCMDYFIPRCDGWRALFEAHTHKQAWIPHLGRVGVETGCLADVFDYARRGKVVYGTETLSIGYGECVMDHGSVDQNSCRAVICGWEGKI